MITDETIQKVFIEAPSPGCGMMYLWMLAHGDRFYTQTEIVRGFGQKKRMVRHKLYKLIEVGMVRRIYNPGSGRKPIYEITKYKN